MVVEEVEEVEVAVEETAEETIEVIIEVAIEGVWEEVEVGDLDFQEVAIKVEGRVEEEVKVEVEVIAEVPLEAKAVTIDLKDSKPEIKEVQVPVEVLEEEIEILLQIITEDHHAEMTYQIIIVHQIIINQEE